MGRLGSARLGSARLGSARLGSLIAQVSTKLFQNNFLAVFPTFSGLSKKIKIFLDSWRHFSDIILTPGRGPAEWESHSRKKVL